MDYRIVDNGRNKNNNHGRWEWKPFLRQMHIASGVWTIYYVAGLCSGAPTVFIPQLRRQAKPGEEIDEDLASWLYSVSNMTAIPWVLILPSFTRYTGRKPPYILSCITISAVFVIFYFSTSCYHILIAEVIQGYFNASNVTVMTMILNEYSSPKYRGIFMNIAIASFYWGMWTSNAIGTFFHWKYIAIVGIICSAYTYTVTFYPESPAWLAYKGKFKESEIAFKLLHGSSEASNKELQDIIRSQIDCVEGAVKSHNSKIMFKRKEFYRPLILVLVIGAQYNFSGKMVCSVYAIDIISKMTDSEETAYLGMLILDGITLVAMYFASYLATILKRRTQNLTFGFMGVFFLLVMSLYLYLVKLSIIAENSIVTILLLVTYSLSIACGSVMATYSEIIPLRYQTVIYMISSLSFMGSASVMLKLAPMTFKYMEVHGAFLFYGVTCGFFTFILYLYLPETKDKTLSELAEVFKDTQLNDKTEQEKELVKLRDMEAVL